MKNFLTVHVAGTNGKGSVSTKIAAALEAQGYKTGLYTSPHIDSFRERIQINGVMIPEDEVARFQAPAGSTFFEAATLLAFQYFTEQKVDIAVIETGIGGRLDATNVITPLVSVITSIGLDHMDQLGPTIEQIAREKAGIIKKGVPVILGRDVPYQIMKERAEALGCPIYQSTLQHVDFDKENQATAHLALSVLKTFLPLSDSSIEKGLTAVPPCRFERHQREKEIILDVAHNGHGFERLIERLKAVFPNHTYRFVVGFSKGKDIAECARLIEAAASGIHLVSSSHPRLSQATELARTFQNGLIENSIVEGIKNALEAATVQKEVVVIAGSFFIMSEVRLFIEVEKA